MQTPRQQRISLRPSITTVSARHARPLHGVENDDDPTRPGGYGIALMPDAPVKKTDVARQDRVIRRVLGAAIPDGDACTGAGAMGQRSCYSTVYAWCTPDSRLSKTRLPEHAYGWYFEFVHKLHSYRRLQRGRR